MSVTALKILQSISEEELKSKEETKENFVERTMERFRTLYGSKISEQEYGKYEDCAKEIEKG